MNQNNHRPVHSYPAIKNFLVVSSFFVPIIAIPYLLARRHISTLRLQLREFEQHANALQRDLSNTKAHLALVENEYRRNVVQLQELNEEMRIVRMQVVKTARQGQSAAEKSKTDIQKLAVGMQRTRALGNTQRTALRALGLSLADVAAFMHEIELAMGLRGQKQDQRGIERLRLLALKMQSLRGESRRSSKGIK